MKALQPAEYVGLDSAYLARLPSWHQIRRLPYQVQGEVIAGLVRAVTHERSSNDRKSSEVRISLRLLALRLTMIALQAAMLATKEAL